MSRSVIGGARISIHMYTDLSFLRQSLDSIFVNELLISLNSGTCKKPRIFTNPLK